MNKKNQNAVESMKKLSNSLTGDAKSVVESFIEFAEGLEADANEHNVTDLADKFNELVATVAKQNEEIAEKMQKLRNDMQAGSAKSVKEKVSGKVANEVAHILLTAKTKDSCIAELNDCMKRNDITGLSYAGLVDYAIQIKQDESDDIFDALYKTGRSKWFYAELDESEAAQIAKQWNGEGEGVTEKDIQELAVEGKEISTKYIYKRQRVANEDLDDAREAGQEGALVSDIRAELRKAVKALAVKSILVGDTINGNGSKVTVFETIGTKTATDLHTTVINPETASTVTLKDVRKAAAAVKSERKWLFVTEALKLELATRIYAAGGSEFFFTDDELAAQLGVDRVIAKDYLSEESGLHAIVLDPSEYWVKEKKVADVAFPQYEKNTFNYLYEINMGGAIHGLQSTAVLREAE